MEYLSEVMESAEKRVDGILKDVPISCYQIYDEQGELAEQDFLYLEDEVTFDYYPEFGEKITVSGNIYYQFLSGMLYVCTEQGVEIPWDLFKYSDDYDLLTVKRKTEGE